MRRRFLLKSFRSILHKQLSYFLTFIFYNYYRLEEEHLREELFLEMKNYSFFLDSDKFDVDITSKVDGENFYELYFNGTRIYILVPIPDDTESVLQIIYPLSKYSVEIDRVKGILSKTVLSTIYSGSSNIVSSSPYILCTHLRRAYSHT